MLNQKAIATYIKLGVTLFFISAFYGWLIRYNSVSEFSFFNYAKFLQAHSHVTFLGWGFMSVTALFNWLFLQKNTAFNKFYKWIFGIEFISIGLMLISFPLQGYKVFSIALLSIFLITSYVYIFKFYSDLRRSKQDKTIVQFINASLFFYLLSSVGIWSIGITAATQGKTDLYFNSIYFYLHFLYNGFFVFALFGLFFYQFIKKEIKFQHKTLKLFFWLTFITCIPAYLLSLVKYDSTLITTINFSVGSFQVLSLYFLMKLSKSLRFKGVNQFIFMAIIIAYTLKITLQFGSAFPQISDTIIGLKSYFVIGYIHLVTLGFVSSSIILLLLEFNLLKIENKLTKMGLFLFFLGVITTEIVLFLQGVLVWFYQSAIPNYPDIILMASSVLLFGIASLLLSLFLKKRY